MGYKLKMLKRNAQKQHGPQYSELEQSKEVTEMRKYIVKSTKRSMKLSLSKLRSEDVTRYHRLNTAYDWPHKTLETILLLSLSFIGRVIQVFLDGRTADLLETIIMSNT